MKEWSELSREEKIKKLFQYPDLMRDFQAKDLWGPKAKGCNNIISFPTKTPWEEILIVIQNSTDPQCVYISLTEKDFCVPTTDNLNQSKFIIENDFEIQYNHARPEFEYKAFLAWRAEMLERHGPKQLQLELFNMDLIVCRVCIQEGDYGDEQGFGIEPDLWASALLNLKGEIVHPFMPGYILSIGE